MTELIKYNGKEYPVRMSYYALKHTSRELKETTGKELSLDDIFKQSMEVYEPLLYYSLVAGHKAEGEELELKRDDIEFVLDECLYQFIELLPTFFPKKDETGIKEDKSGK